MASAFQGGSQWRIWDLHVHSPCSLLNNQYPELADGEPDWNAFLTKLEACPTAVVGITDYFTIDGYKRVREFKAQGRIPRIQTVLPNIEFRLKNIVAARNGSEVRLNLHVIFSDEVSVEDIEEHFLHDLNFFFQGDPDNPAERKSLKTANLEALGRTLLEQHEEFRRQGVSPLQLGAMQAVVDHDKITEILTSDGRFRGKWLVCLAAADWDRIDWNGQAHHVRKGLLQKSHMVFASNPNTRQWCLGNPPYADGPASFVREFTTLKPCIHGSDAHRIDEIGRPCARRGDQAHTCGDPASPCDLLYCWIKADPTFEGLKQLLYEPEDRVHIGAVDPSPVVSNYTIQGIRLSPTVYSDDLSIADTSLEVNSSLVAIVGGKGAGKTALVDLVANCYQDRAASANKNSFVRRVVEYRAPQRTTIRFRDGSEFAKTLGETGCFDTEQVSYIAQAELENYISEGSDLHRRITSLIFESASIKDTLLSFEYSEAVQRTSELEETLGSLNEQIETLEQHTSTELKAGFDRETKRVENDQQDIENRIKELEKARGKATAQAAEDEQQRIAELKTRRDDLVAVRDLLDQALSFVDEDVDEFNAVVESANELMKKLALNVNLPELTYSGESQLRETLELVRAETKRTVAAIEVEQKKQDRLEAGIRDHAKLLDRRRELKKAKETLERQLAKLKAAEEQLQAVELMRTKQMGELLRSILDQKKKYSEIIAAFSKDKAEILSDIDFVAEARLDVDGFLESAEAILDRRKVTIRDDDGAPSDFDALLKELRKVASGEDSAVDRAVDQLARCNRHLRTRTKAAPITIKDLYDLLYKNYMQVVPVVKYKKTDLEKQSLGQKATVLIKVYLAHGDKPIIIDSHDDHLDNEFIMAELVTAIRKAKLVRQIVLVSNNGNVVINSDAEQIIVATRSTDGQISYSAGAIENTEVRERALQVLEGGREAFRKRQEKYRMVN